ncbi:hypothetical protein [Actinomadura verrucosospora]|uniref:hypothetical protein n=1 Tax=Actinomadura verrucosospora TaxID=46165 RepID=UPI00156331CA|nr:hypothetical protein [Actinomadura verrucosospora]
MKSISTSWKRPVVEGVQFLPLTHGGEMAGTGPASAQLKVMAAAWRGVPAWAAGAQCQR